MADRQRRELFHAPAVDVADANKDSTDALLRKRCEGRFEIAVGSGTRKTELHAQRARPHLKVCDEGWGSRRGRVHENAELDSIGYQLMEQLQLFRRQFGR